MLDILIEQNEGHGTGNNTMYNEKHHLISAFVRIRFIKLPVFVPYSTLSE